VKGSPFKQGSTNRAHVLQRPDTVQLSVWVKAAEAAESAEA